MSMQSLSKLLCYKWQGLLQLDCKECNWYSPYRLDQNVSDTMYCEWLIIYMLNAFTTQAHTRGGVAHNNQTAILYQTCIPWALRQIRCTSDLIILSNCFLRQLGFQNISAAQIEIQKITLILKILKIENLAAVETQLRQIKDFGFQRR